MFLSNPAKFFLASILLFFVFAGCRFWQNNQNTSVPLISETKDEFPFSTKEPEIFQAEIVVTSGDTERKTFIARNGERRRIDYNFGEENQHSVLQTDKEYVISNRKKIYAEILPRSRLSANQTPQNDLTSELLNRRDYAKFEKLGREDNLTRYRVRINESDASEILIYVDETIGIPVKQEFFSVNGEQKTLQYSVEMKNFKLETGDKLFAIPAGFRKVSIDEFFRGLTRMSEKSK